MAKKIAPLSQTQLGIYLDCLSMADAGAYNRHFLFTLDDSIDLNRLAAAIEKAIAAHPAMNVRITERDGEPFQEFSAEDYHQTVEQMTEEDWQKKLSELVATPLELHGGRLFRFDLVQTEKAKYLLRTTHHIFFDGMAYKALFDAVAKVYADPAAELEPESYDALDAANDEMQARSSETFTQAKNWYEKTFSGIELEALPLPDRNDEKFSFDTFTKTFPLDYSTLRSFCKANKISASALTSAAFALTLGTYTNQQESLFSTIYHGRKDERTKNIVGMFVKTLPVYCRWTGDKKIAEFLSEITEQIKSARENDLFSYADLNQICPMNNAPMFAYHGLIRTTSELCGKPCKEEILDVNTTGIPLDVELMSVADGMKIHFEYNSARYSGKFIETFAACYENVLRQLMTKTFVREVELLDAEQIKILDAFNKSEVDYDKSQTVISLFNQAVKKFPNNTAVIFEDKKFTYSEVDKISNDIAAYILSKNIGKGDVVSILIPRCEFMVLAPLGALKAGCTYQPLDSTYPSERLNFMVKDAAAKILITTKELRSLISDFDGEVLFIGEIPHAENFLPEYVNSPEDIFILLYTSGSTGVPKGVRLTHANLVCFIHWYQKYYDLNEKDCVGAYASFGFDVCMEDMYSTLANGACLCIVPEEMRFNLVDLNLYLEKNKVNYIHMTTQIGRQFATEMDNHSLEALTVGGEKLATMDPPKNYALYNTYGPTETTISVSEFKVKKAEDNIPIGKPLDNVKLYIVDLNGHRVPVGALGELWAAGIQVGAGYLNRPEKTAEVFIQNPFDGGEYSRAYRTGDVVRYRADGNIEFMGRRDGQVKIRGFRIELSEVEAVIREFDGIKDVTVVAFDHPAGGKFIAAYVVGAEKISIDELNKFIAERKPPYMVPTVTMQIDSIPFNQNGKVNRRALPKAEISTSDKEIVQPRTDAEKKVCAILAEIIGTNNFGVTATFDELGINSIAMMRLTLKLSREFSRPLNFADLRQYNTPEKLAAFMQAEQISDEEFPILEDYPLTKTQEGIFFETQSHEGTTIYNIPLLLEFDGSVDVVRLKEAIAAAVNAHSYLLTRFFQNDEGELRQRRPKEINFTARDIQEVRCKNLEDLKKQLVRPYDLLNDQLFRISIASTEDGKTYLYMDFHHSVFDGASRQIFIRDIERAYDGQTLSPEKFSGYEVALFEERLRSGEQYQKSKDYYTKIFDGCESDCLPLSDIEAGDATKSFGAKVIAGKADLKAIKDFCASAGVTENAFYTAAFGYVIARYGGRDDAIFTTINNGRSDTRFADSISMFVRTYPVLCNIKTGSVSNYIRETAQQLTDSLSYGAYSFGEISRDLDIRSDLLFAFQGAVNQKTESFCGVPCKEVAVSLDEAKAGITFMVYPQGNSVVYQVTCRAGLYTEDFIQRFVRAYDFCLSEFVVKENLSAIGLCDAEEINLLNSFNATEVDYDKNQTVVSLFNAAAKKFPNNTAVIFEDKKFTYSEVDRISNDIAAYILSKNIGKGNVASILIPRCEFMPIAALGALKAGCAYQPLDPTYPPERLNFMIKDTAAKILITTKELRPLLTDYNGEVLFIDEIPPADKVTLPEVKPENIFILLYTSGSTGIPKGVRLTHKNLVCFINWYKKYYGLNESHCVGAYASFGFDANMFDTYPALTSGAAICIVPEEMRLDLESMNAYFEKNNVTHAFMTTQVGRQFATDIDNHSLKYLTVGGEKLVTLDPPKNFSLINGYGPTECTILITSFKVERAENNIPIGKPLDNVKLYIVDLNGHRVPVGACGELWAAGIQVGAGYLNRPEKTAEVFIKNPFDGGEYSQAYRTGDVVRYRADGNIEFIGRRDGQVKIRGFRIELTEVESVVREFDGVKDATVAAFDHPAGGKFIAAYVVGDSKIDIDELNKFIAEHKPPYMVPAVTMQIDKIPLNQNSKVNRRALPKPELQTAKEDNAKRSLNVLEKSLIEIIGSVIGLKEFSVTTELNYLGLASISAIKLATKIYKKFGISIAVKKLLGGTVESIENNLLDYWMSGNFAEQKKIAPQLKSAKISNAQRGIYLECMKNPLSTSYNVPLIYNFEPDTDVAKLSDAVKKIIAAHPSINVHFELRDDKIMLVSNKNAETNIPVHNFDEKDFDAFKNNFVRPFKFDAEPLYRIEIVKTPARVSLFVDFHHIIFDGASLNLFLANLKTLLEGGKVEHENASYFDFVCEEEKNFDTNKQFFSDMLKDFESASEITSDVHGKTDGETKIFEQAISNVENFCNENKLTPAALCFAALSYVVARYSANRKVYLTTISSGRSNVKFSDTFGMFVNTLPLAAELENISVADFLKKTAKNFAATIEHENYPFVQIAADYSFDPKIMYEYQVGVVEEYNIPKFIGVEKFPHGAAKFKLIVRVVGENSAPRLSIEYNSADYTDNLIAGLAKSFNIVLKKFTEQDNQPVRKISLLDDERAKILSTFRSNTDPATIGKVYHYFHEGFEEQATKNPDKVALIAADCSLTYRELDEGANKIANALIERGIKPQNRVALLLPRTSCAILSIFGVLKAGCAYIPCDTEYPAERINQIIEDSAAAYIITTADRITDEKSLDVEELLTHENSTRPNVKISPEDLAYLIYTSGSTGKPKGVMIAHRNAANFFTNNPANIMVDILVKNVRNFVSVSTFSFDLTLKEIILPLFNGLTLVLADKEQANNPDKLAELILRTNGDAINATPSRIYQYLESEAFSNALKDFNFIGSGGEKYPEALLAKLRTITKARIINTYGPTETTISANMKDLTHAENISVGRPLLNVTEFIVDGDGNELPPGIVGELYIGGAGVGKGYNNLPKMTAERFIDYNGVRVYKSGDYARWTSTGDVEILGRLDNQIKLRGLRIELGEVESTLAKVDGIKTYLVKIAKIKGIEHLCAYFTADRILDTEELKKILGETLPKYMVPTAYLQLKKMPMTLNGKIDAKSLPEATISRSGTTSKAANKVEEDFCKIFGSILQLEDVGADESFFDLGGTSLLVTRVVIMAKKLGYKVNFADVFANCTPRKLTALQKIDKTAVVNDEIANYDYSKLQNILDANTLDNFRNGQRQPLGNIVLTGATGYLGIHILHEFIENHAGKVYCLLRGKKDLPAETRLKAQLFYYFDQSYAELFGKRVFILEGDVARPDTLEQIKSIPDVSTVINCAALVKHFETGNEIETVNVGGVKNLIDICKARNLQFIQVSTMSTVNSGVKGEVDENVIPTERTLYFRQNLTNKYVHSKFLAERAILDAIANDGLNAKIMRVGTLSARYSDGEFQINAGTNSSMGRLKIFAIIGCCPFAQMDKLIEFSPIDEAAKTILLLSETPKECVIFHPINHHNMAIGDVVRVMKSCGLDINFVEQDDFQKAWQAAEEDPDKAEILTSSIAYRSGNKDTEVITFPKNNLYTMQILYRLGYSWPLTTWKYVETFINMLQKLGFFSV